MLELTQPTWCFCSCFYSPVDFSSSRIVCITIETLYFRCLKLALIFQIACSRVEEHGTLWECFVLVLFIFSVPRRRVFFEPCSIGGIGREKKLTLLCFVDFDCCRCPGTQRWMCAGTLWWMEHRMSASRCGVALRTPSSSFTPAVLLANQRYCVC